MFRKLGHIVLCRWNYVCDIKFSVRLKSVRHHGRWLVVGCISAVWHVVHERYTSHAVMAEGSTPHHYTGQPFTWQAVLHTMSNWSPGADGCHSRTTTVTTCRTTWATDDVGAACKTSISTCCTGLYRILFYNFFCSPIAVASPVLLGQMKKCATILRECVIVKASDWWSRGCTGTILSVPLSWNDIIDFIKETGFYKQL